jgi:hypothetical protein
MAEPRKSDCNLQLKCLRSNSQLERKILETTHRQSLPLDLVARLGRNLVETFHRVLAVSPRMAIAALSHGNPLRHREEAPI